MEVSITHRAAGGVGGILITSASRNAAVLLSSAHGHRVKVVRCGEPADTCVNEAGRLFCIGLIQRKSPARLWGQTELVLMLATHNLRMSPQVHFFTPASTGLLMCEMGLMTPTSSDFCEN